MLGRGLAPRAALEEALVQVGAAITSSAATVIAATAVMIFATFDLFWTLGPAIAISIAVMLLSGLTLLPALMSIFGRALLWPRKRVQGGPRQSIAAFARHRRIRRREARPGRGHPPREDTNGTAAAATVDATERVARQAAPRASVLAAGSPASIRGLHDLIYHDFLLIAALVGGAIFVVLALLLRSLLAPLYLLFTVGQGRGARAARQGGS
jgi:uncharacterized membrane protein YdfJ with MMPL/SSD domain